jgi:hypothetical protein
MTFECLMVLLVAKGSGSDAAACWPVWALALALSNKPKAAITTDAVKPGASALRLIEISRYALASGFLRES